MTKLSNNYLKTDIEMAKIVKHAGDVRLMEISQHCRIKGGGGEEGVKRAMWPPPPVASGQITGILTLYNT